MLLLIGASTRQSREFVLKSVSTRYRLWLLQPASVSWEEPYIVGSTVVDNTDPAPLVSAAREIDRQQHVSGVLCYNEGLVWPAAFVSQALGLPGNNPPAVAACRDKHATRVALDEAGIGQPASFGVCSLAEAVAAADKIGYPVVVKPRGLAASMGVKRADRREDLAVAYDIAGAAFYPGVPVFDMGVLVEEYADGPVISVDTVFFDGSCVPLIVARMELGFDPFFEEIAYVVDGADPLLYDEVLLDILRRSHAALGIHTGITHTEFRLTRRGPRLLEINARPGSGLIPYLGQLATGVDSAMVAADVAAGRRPDTEVRFRRAAAITFLFPEQDVEVESVTINERLLAPEIHSALVFAEPGAILRLPPRGYDLPYGGVIAISDSPEQAQAALADAHGLIRLEARPALWP